MTVDITAFTDPGPRRANEDAVCGTVLPGGEILLAVADGLGGHFGGAEASSIAIDTLKDAALKASGSSSLPRLGKATLEKIFGDIHNRVFLEQNYRPELKGMATTATAVIINGLSLIGAHCGDTRCIIQRGDGIKKLTIEHTEAQRLFDAGKLTKDEFIQYPRRNILDRALGAQHLPQVDTFEFNLKIGDKIVITSDGVHELIKLRDLLQLMQGKKTAEEVSSIIISAVRERTPEDNFSFVVATIT